MVSGPGHGAVLDGEPPVPGPGQVVVDVARVGVCGTDVEFFTGEMDYLRTGHAAYPMRLGHEWCGRVSQVGDGVDAGWLGRRVTGDTMLGCGRCQRCLAGRHWVCAERSEIGIRSGFAGALAEQLAVPAAALLPLPDALDDVAGALVEPGGNAVRSVLAADLASGERLLVAGLGTIGLLAALVARSQGVEVHLVGRAGESGDFARSLGVEGAWDAEDLPALRFDAVVDASNGTAVPARALELVEPGRRVVLIGLAGAPSNIDSRALVLKDVTAVGILGASAGLAGAVAAYAGGAVDPRPLVAATVGLEEVAGVLAGRRPVGAGPGPKVHVDPRRLPECPFPRPSCGTVGG